MHRRERERERDRERETKKLKLCMEDSGKLLSGFKRRENMKILEKYVKITQTDHKDNFLR